jgi:hypothetical protein
MVDMATPTAKRLTDTKPAINRRHLLLKIGKPLGQLDA